MSVTNQEAISEKMLPGVFFNFLSNYGAEFHPHGFLQNFANCLEPSELSFRTRCLMKVWGLFYFTKVCGFEYFGNPESISSEESDVINWGPPKKALVVDTHISKIRLVLFVVGLVYLFFKGPEWFALVGFVAHRIAEQILSLLTIYTPGVASCIQGGALSGGIGALLAVITVLACINIFTFVWGKVFPFPKNTYVVIPVGKEFKKIAEQLTDENTQRFLSEQEKLLPAREKLVAHAFKNRMRALNVLNDIELGFWTQIKNRWVACLQEAWQKTGGTSTNKHSAAVGLVNLVDFDLRGTASVKGGDRKGGRAPAAVPSMSQSAGGEERAPDAAPSMSQGAEGEGRAPDAAPSMSQSAGSGERVEKLFAKLSRNGKAKSFGSTFSLTEPPKKGKAKGFGSIGALTELSLGNEESQADLVQLHKVISAVQNLGWTCATAPTGVRIEPSGDKEKDAEAVTAVLTMIVQAVEAEKQDTAIAAMRVQSEICCIRNLKAACAAVKCLKPVEQT